MFLSIITINRNNAAGLKKTMLSVLNQTCADYEYVVIDGASTDNSLDIIKSFSALFGEKLTWVSEPDSGIYNAMNKGIGMATGKYLEFLNSGDYLATQGIIEELELAIEKMDYPSIIYGNLLKKMNDGRLLRDKGMAGQSCSFLDFYIGTINHSSSLIKRDLFLKYGWYDESLKIVSDWKWFLMVTVFGGEKPCYVDKDVTVFDMNGISETNRKQMLLERSAVLQDTISPAVLKDYDDWAQSIIKMKRIQRHPWARWVFHILERFLFKLERIKK